MVKDHTLNWLLKKKKKEALTLILILKLSIAEVNVL